MLAQKYLGKPYPWYGGRDQVRVISSSRLSTSAAGRVPDQLLYAIPAVQCTN